MIQTFNKKVIFWLVTAACLLLMGCWNLFQPALNAASPVSSSAVRLGLMGDSATDEYRGTDNRGGDYHSVTFNWLEQLVRGERVYAGEWGNWAEPRRTGYAYNWARSGAKAADMIEAGQHTGLAAQVASGEIDIVFISIGSNDFAPYRSDYLAIYSDALNDDALQQKIDNIVANITEAVDTVRASGNIPILLATVPDWNWSPSIQADSRYADANRRQRVSDAVAAVNAGLAALVESRQNVTLIDQGLFVQQIFGAAQTGEFKTGNVSVNLLGQGNEPHNGILGDGIHAGTVMQGNLANMYLEYINQVVDPDIPRLSDEEILKNAGLG